METLRQARPEDAVRREQVNEDQRSASHVVPVDTLELFLFVFAESFLKPERWPVGPRGSELPADWGRGLRGFPEPALNLAFPLETCHDLEIHRAGQFDYGVVESS
jgi:hypothetical protein